MHRSIAQLATLVTRIDELSADQPLDPGDAVILDVVYEKLGQIRARCSQAAEALAPTTEPADSAQTALG